MVKLRISLFYGSYMFEIQIVINKYLDLHKNICRFKGNYYDRLHYASETDKILELCEEYNALFMFNLMIQAPMMKYANYFKEMWDWDHYKHDGNLPLSTEFWEWDDPVYCYNDDPSYVKPDQTIHVGTKKPYEMFTNESDLAYHKQRTRYYIARYGYSTKIYAFELLSEPWHLGEAWTNGQSNQGGGAPFLDPSNSDHDSTRYAIYNYHKVISEYIKDSLNHNKQLIGINMASELNASQGGLDFSVILPSIDFVGFNPYYSVPNALMKSNTNHIKGYVHGINFLRNNVGINSVPIIISEGGTDEKYMECSNFDLDIVDKMTLPFTGVAGINTWLGYRPNFLKDENDVVTMPNRTYDMWDNTIRVKNHMNGNDVINTLSDTWGGWSHGMGKGKLKENDYDDVEAVEMQAYVSSNQELIVGYIKNRTYNVYTQSSGGLCDNVGWKNPGNNPVNSLYNFYWDDIKILEKLKVDDVLDLKTYNIDFYGDLNGSINYLSSDSKLSSASGKLKLRYPELYVEEHWQNRPVIWFVAKSEDYNSMMQDNDIVEDSTNVLLMKVLSNKEDSLSQDPSLSVYPNPFGDYFIIESSTDNEILIQEPTGRIVMQQKVSKGQNRIQTQRLTKGIYFVSFFNQNKSFKIIKR